jgi:hypothetical protein
MPELRRLVNAIGLHGIFQRCGVTKIPEVWQVKTSPAVTDVFKGIWEEVYPAVRDGSMPLLCSQDAINFGFPNGTASGKDDSWPHADRHPDTPDHCVQGFVDMTHRRRWNADLTVCTGFELTDCDDTMGGLRLLPRSHLKFARAMAKVKEGRAHAGNDTPKFPPSKNWIPLCDEELVEHYDAQRGDDGRVEFYNVFAKPGDVILFDSRTVHWGCRPEPGPMDAETRRRRNEDSVRCVVYVCMTPKAMARDRGVLDKKIKSYLMGRMTSHWPHKVVLFPHKGLTRGNPVVTEALENADAEQVYELPDWRIMGWPTAQLSDTDRQRLLAEARQEGAHRSRAAGAGGKKESECAARMRRLLVKR